MTQWIFRADACCCEQPELDEQVVRSPATIDDETEMELDLDESKFPSQRYKAIKELGMGGSGTVYLCKDRVLGKTVAVKTLRRLTAEQLIAFQTEARATSKLDHPAIVALLDFGPTESGAPYMVLEYFDGITLENYLRSHGPLPLALFKPIFLEVMSALSRAHELKVFHRDLKPANILIARFNTDKPRIKLIDFGVAHVKETTSEALQIQGKTIAGTPAYMSPDVVAGKTFDCRSEIYSLGCVMFEALTGSPPFKGETALETMNMQAQMAAPTLKDVSGQIFPDKVDKLIERCLAKDPDKRFASMDEVSEALKKAIRTVDDSFYSQSFKSTQVPTTAVVSKSNPNHIAVVAVMLVIPIFSFCWFWAFQQAQDRQVTHHKKRKKKKKHVADELNELEMAPQNVKKDDIADGASLGQFLELGDRYYSGRGAQRDYSEALNCYRKAAELGSARAQNQVGYMYQNGQGVGKSYKAAAEWFLKSAEQGFPAAQNNLAFLYHRGFGVSKDYKQAMKWYQKSAAQGYAAAQNNIGSMYEDGEGVPINYKKAMEWFRKAAEQGAPEAQTNLGSLYGIHENYKEAMFWYQRAAAKGHVEAQARIGAAFLKGEGVKKDVREAERWFEKAAENGEATAQYHLGVMYLSGSGVSKDYKKAAFLFRKAAVQGDFDAKTVLASMYMRGLGVEQDFKQAIVLLQDAASNGEPLAQFSLGLCYLAGNGVTMDSNRGASWIRTAADQGYAPAITQLGSLYSEGKGVPKDSSRALKLFQQAAAQGDKAAKQRLDLLLKKQKTE